MDPCSLSNLEYYEALSLDWTINVDFTREVLSCVAKQQFQCIKDGSTVLVCAFGTLFIMFSVYKCV